MCNPLLCAMCNLTIKYDFNYTINDKLSFYSSISFFLFSSFAKIIPYFYYHHIAYTPIMHNSSQMRNYFKYAIKNVHAAFNGHRLIGHTSRVTML